MTRFNLSTTVILAFIAIVTLAPVPGSTQSQSVPEPEDSVARRPAGFDNSAFDGEILPVFYVHDVLASVVFYVDTLGFTCHHFFDHINGGSVFEWPYDEPPIYAEMRAGTQKFAVHRASKPDSLSVGGTRHYFGVTNVREHHKRVRHMGVEVGDIVERAWMHMYRVIDPDGHELFIFTRPNESGPDEE